MRDRARARAFHSAFPSEDKLPPRAARSSRYLFMANSKEERTFWIRAITSAAAPAAAPLAASAPLDGDGLGATALQGLFDPT